MRVGLLTQWYDPEPGPASLPGVLARGLLDRGHDVQVLTGFPNYPTGKLAPGYRMARRLDEDRDGVRVRRVALYPNHDAAAHRRFANYASFGSSAVLSGLDAMKGIDALWVYNSPITVAWPMWWLHRRWGIPVVLHVMDLWPDTVLASGFAHGGALYGALSKGLDAWCSAMYRTAFAVAYISPGMGSVLTERGVSVDKLAYVPVWADESVFKPSRADLRSELGIAEDTVVLLYAGTMGVAQGIETLVEACAKIDDPRFTCLITGSGVTEMALRRQAERIAPNIRFLGRLPKEQLTSLMATGDLHYVGLRPHTSSSVAMPSKVQATLAAGRALLISAEGDAAAVGTDSDAAFVVPPGDPEAVADSIRAACRSGRSHLQVLGRSARKYYESTFSLERGVTRVEALLHDAAATRGGPV